jgi:PilZ domain
VFDPCVSPENRGYERSRVWLPIRITVGADEILGVTYDISEKGVLVLAPVEIPALTALSLSFDVPNEPGRSLSAGGKVVHSSPNTVDPGGLWRHRMGVELDEVHGEFRDVIETLIQTGPLSSRR